MTDDDEPNDELGRIVAVYRWGGEGEFIVSITLPDKADIPVITQLGMVELIRHTIYGVMDGQIE